MRRRQDNNCNALARYFLGGLASKEKVAELAQVIYDTVEEWFDKQTTDVVTGRSNEALAADEAHPETRKGEEGRR
jgi:hypothetical protein